MSNFPQFTQRFTLLFVPCTLMLISLLSACGSQASLSGTSGPSQQTPTPASTASQGIPQLTQQYEFTERDSGKTVTYTVTSRFGIILNREQYPKEHIQVSCNPAHTLGYISNIPSEPPALYTVRYEGVQAGICTIKNGTFLLNVKIVALTR